MAIRLKTCTVPIRISGRISAIEKLYWKASKDLDRRFRTWMDKAIYEDAAKRKR